jgi:flagellar motility protein MotE (MotC chaperone)
MKKLLIVGGMSLILFVLSASASYFWQQKILVLAEHGKEKSAETSAKEAVHSHTERGNDKALTPPASGHDDNAPRAAVRPTYNAGAEEIARMTGELRSRLATVREREEQLAARKKMIELIQEDIRGERTALDELRTQIKNEIEALNEAVEGIEKQRGSLDEERQKISKNTQEMEAKIVQLQKEEQDNLKKMSGMYNSMDPEIAAKILQNLADTGKMDTAVKVLGQMQERQAAKVLAALTDAGLAAQLVEKLKSLRRVPVRPSEPKP